MGGNSTKMEKPKKIKLVYFDLRARGEGIRLTLAYAGIKYEDYRIPFSREADSEWISQIKPTTTWGSLPELHVDNKKISQSLTISRYVAKLAGIYGDTALEQARYDEIVHACQDLFELWIPYVFEEDDVQKDLKKKNIIERLTVLLPQLQKVLGKEKFFGGSKISWADIQYYNLIEIYKQLGFHSVIDNNCKMIELFNSIAEIPRIKNYLDNRKHTDL